MSVCPHQSLLVYIFCIYWYVQYRYLYIAHLWYICIGVCRGRPLGRGVTSGRDGNCAPLHNISLRYTFCHFFSWKKLDLTITYCLFKYRINNCKSLLEKFNGIWSLIHGIFFDQNLKWLDFEQREFQKYEWGGNCKTVKRIV